MGGSTPKGGTGPGDAKLLVEVGGGSGSIDFKIRQHHQ
jgi:hypothetical protein